MRNISKCPTSQRNKLRECHWPDSASSTSCAGLGRSSQGALAQITWLLRFFYHRGALINCWLHHFIVSNWWLQNGLLFLRSPLPSWLRLANEGEVVPPFGDGPVNHPYWSWIDWISDIRDNVNDYVQESSPWLCILLSFGLSPLLHPPEGPGTKPEIRLLVFSPELYRHAHMSNQIPGAFPKQKHRAH